MQKMLEGNDTNDLVQQYLKKEITLDEAVNKAIQTWLSALYQTTSNMTLPRIPGGISTADFQAAFKAVPEKALPFHQTYTIQYGKYLQEMTA